MESQHQGLRRGEVRGGGGLERLSFALDSLARLLGPVLRARLFAKSFLSERRRFRLVAVALLVLGLSSPAHADLGHDVARLLAHWQQEGSVHHPAPRLHERTQPVALVIPDDELGAASCTTVALLGVPTLVFTARVGEQPEAAMRSQAGLLALTRCGADRDQLKHIIVETRSARGVLEAVVVTSDAPPTSALAALPERLPGPVAADDDPGPAPAPPSVVERARALVARQKRRGALDVDHGILQTRSDGTARSMIELAPGCHEITTMGVGPSANSAVDTDLELVLPWGGEGIVAASDRANAPDGFVDVCVGTQQVLGMRVATTLAAGPVLFIHARWPLPTGLPADWNSAERAGMAEALWRKRLKVGKSTPVLQSLGVAGLTLVPVALEPDACYVAAVAVRQDLSTGIAMSARVGPRRHHAYGEELAQSSALAFCAQGVGAGLLEIEVEGNAGLVWHLALWQVARLPLGAVAE